MPIRKDLVEETVGVIKGSYPTRTYDQIANIGIRNGVAVYNAKILLISTTVWLEERNEPVIFVRKNPFKGARKWELGHELGHALLNHIDFDSGPELEREADYFAKLLIGPKPGVEINAATIWPLISNHRELYKFVSNTEYQEEVINRELAIHGLTW